MKIILYVSLVLLCFACKNNSNADVSKIDTPRDENVSMNQILDEKKTESVDKQPIEIRFDKIRPLLIQDLSDDAIEKIKIRLSTEIASSDGLGKEKIFTKSLQRFLEEMPDFIMIEMEPELEKKFQKKWGKKHDVYNTNYMHPFFDGNGGCDKMKLVSFNYLGTYNNAYYVETKIKCFMSEGGDTFKRFFKVIDDGGSYMIDGIYNF